LDAEPFRIIDLLDLLPLKLILNGYWVPTDITVFFNHLGTMGFKTRAVMPITVP
jgi:hypothetical protein